MPVGRQDRNLHARADALATPGVVSLAADGSLWLWPDPESPEYQNPPPVLKLPKQPEWLGNVLAAK
jgi:hypothetical protein